LKTKDIPERMTGLILSRSNGTTRMVENVISYLW
jgi:hypothetical protein